MKLQTILINSEIKEIAEDQESEFSADAVTEYVLMDEDQLQSEAENYLNHALSEFLKSKVEQALEDMQLDSENL